MNMLQLNLVILNINHVIWLSSHPFVLDEQALFLYLSNF